MGLDAILLARIKGKDNWLSAAQVRSLSYKLANTIGWDRFWIQRDRDRHTLVPLPRFDESRPGFQGIAGILAHFEPPIIADHDEQFIEVNLMARYYGVGYPRGDLPTIIFTTWFIERHIPQATIWYGHEHGIAPFDEDSRSELISYFLEEGHTYSLEDETERQSPMCTFCGFPFDWAGGYGKASYWYCSGCGYRAVTERDHFWLLQPNEDYSQIIRTPSSESTDEDQADNEAT